jgi:phage terminase large subunit-like protein
VTFQIIVCGVAVSADGAEWGLVVVGLTEGGARGRAIVLADESGRMPSGEAARRVCELSAGGKVSVAVVAKDAAERFVGLLAMAAREGAMPPPAHPIPIGDASGLWTGLLKTAYEAERLTHADGLEALERAVTDYRPGVDSSRVGALLAAVSYLRDIGGLSGAGTPWESGQTAAPRASMIDRRPDDGKRGQPGAKT